MLDPLCCKYRTFSPARVTSAASHPHANKGSTSCLISCAANIAHSYRAWAWTRLIYTVCELLKSLLCLRAPVLSCHIQRRIIPDQWAVTVHPARDCRPCHTLFLRAATPAVTTLSLPPTTLPRPFLHFLRLSRHVYTHCRLCSRR